MQTPVKSSSSPKIVRPPILPIFGRTLTLLSAIALCMGIAFTWYSKGISWVYDSESSNVVILQCPAYWYTFTGQVPEGPFCQLSIKRTQETLDTMTLGNLFASNSNYRCIRPTNNEDPIVCNLDRTCTESCQMVDGSGVCRDPASLPAVPYGSKGPLCQAVFGVNPLTGETVEGFDLPCSSLLVGSYCDSSFLVTASNSLAMRGVVAGALLVALIWFVAEWVLRSVDIDLRREKATGMARMDIELPEKRAILRRSLEQRWKQESEACSEDDFGFSSRASSSVWTRDAGARFTSTQWCRRIAQWKKLRAEKSSSFQPKEFFRTLMLNAFFIALLVVTFYVIILISPQNISLVENWDGSLIGKVSVWKMDYWIDVLIFVDILLDTVLFLIAVVAVKWPKSGVFSQHIQDQIRTVESNAVVAASSGRFFMEDDRDDVGSLSISSLGEGSSHCVSNEDDGVSFILNQAMSLDTCLMIACHCSTMTAERCATFSNTLRSALTVFPPSHIFVCDNGPTMSPQDETQWIAKQVHPDINYLYVPEGNKTFAFYWCNKYWIPYLAKCGRVENFTYAVIIDDDVPLPADLHIPHEHLKKDPNIKAVHFPITATTPDGRFNLLVSCQDIEYKLAAVHKLLQAAMSRSLSCHGAIALWDRGAMAEVLSEHDTVFNGEDLYMGLCLLRKRDKSTIISCAQTIVPTYAPDHFRLLFRQRVKSWELTSHKKSFTFLIELINPVSFCHFASICLKPYFLQELLTITLDWMRIFLLAGLLLRDTLGLLLMTFFFTGVLYFQLILFQFVILRERKDLRSSFTTVLTFPFYKLLNLIFRICALCQNLLVYSHERKGLKISKREDEIRDIPPCPPHYLVDWFSIWELEPSLERSKSSLSRTLSKRTSRQLV